MMHRVFYLESTFYRMFLGHRQPTLVIVQGFCFRICLFGFLSTNLLVICVSQSQLSQLNSRDSSLGHAVLLKQEN